MTLVVAKLEEDVMMYSEDVKDLAVLVRRKQIQTELKRHCSIQSAFDHKNLAIDSLLECCPDPKWFDKSVSERDIARVADYHGSTFGYDAIAALVLSEYAEELAALNARLNAIHGV